MPKREQFIKSIFSITDAQNFNELALEIFHYQYEHISIYNEYLNLINVKTDSISHFSEIPFLPISFFKSHAIIKEKEKAQKIFRSSGTTGQTTSQHFINDLSLYEKSFTKHFYEVYKEAKDSIIIGLLPSYLERNDSSLVYMVNELIAQSSAPQSGFYLHANDELLNVIHEAQKEGKEVILFGVTFALLELCEKHAPLNWSHVTVIETGGMKGRGKELTRTELHDELSKGLGCKNIHSEYGMTELLSQAYSSSEWFTCPNWMKVLVRDVDDPFALYTESKRGGINIIDLANIDSCSFIATEDLGELDANGRFKVLGRFDQSEIRGCNLMVTEL